MGSRPGESYEPAPKTFVKYRRQDVSRAPGLASLYPSLYLKGGLRATAALTFTELFLESATVPSACYLLRLRFPRATGK